MTEQHMTPSTMTSSMTSSTGGDPSTATTFTTPVVSGHPQVDAVLESLQPLDELPVEQHVAVFEAAHTALREALSSAADAGAAHG